LGEQQKIPSEYKFTLPLSHTGLVAIVGDDLKIGRSPYEILQVLGVFLLDKTPVNELLTNIDYKDVKEQNHNQLLFSFF